MILRKSGLRSENTVRKSPVATTMRSTSSNFNGIRTDLSLRDLDDEELAIMQREMTNWSIPIAKPNDFEANFRPSFFNHLPPLSVNEPAYSEVPRIFDRGGLTQSCPVKELSYSRSVSDTIANNYSPLARDLDVRNLSRYENNTKQSRNSYVKAALNRQQFTAKTPYGASSLSRERTQPAGTLRASMSRKTTKVSFDIEPMTSDGDGNKLPPIGNLNRSSTFFSQPEKTVCWTRNRTGSDVRRITPKHNDQTQACLSVTFAPCFTSTVGLTRPNTPIGRDVPRFYSLVDKAIDPAVVAPIDDEAINRIVKLVPTDLQAKHKKLTESTITEAKEDYNRAIRISLLNYILMDPVEQARLGVTALKRAPVSAEPPIYPWRPTVLRIRGWMANDFSATMHIMQKIHRHTMTKYATFKFIDMSRFEREMPLKLPSFVTKAERSIAAASKVLNEQWLDECCQIVQACREDIEHVMPQGLPEIRQAKMDKIFAAIAAVMSNCLRNFMRNTLIDFAEWLDQYKGGNAYQGDYDIFSARFQPVRPVPFFIALNAPTTVDAKRIYTITPGFSDFERILHSIVDKVIESCQQFPRIEFRLFQIVEGLRIKYIRAIRDWEEIVSDVKSQISKVVSANTPGPQRYRGIFEEFSFVIGDEAEAHISRFLARHHLSLVPDFATEIARFQAITKQIERLPRSVAFNFFQLDCVGINVWLAAKSSGYSEQLITYVFDKMVSLCQATSGQYEKITRRLLSKIESTDDLVSLQGYIEHLETAELPRIKLEMVRKAVEHILFVYDYRLLEKDQLAMVTTTTTWPERMKPMVTQMEERIRDMLGQAAIDLTVRTKTFSEQIETFAKRLKEFTQKDKVGDAVQNCEELKEINRIIEGMIEEKKNINHEEVLLNCSDITPFNQIVQLQMRKEPYEKLWNLALNFQKKNDAWMNGPITAVNSGKVEEEVDTLWREVYKLLKIFSRNDTKSPFKVAQNVKSKLEKFKRDLPLITAICNPGLKERHWNAIYDKIGLKIELSDEMTLTAVIQQGLEKYLPVLQEVSARATVEFALEKAIVKMKTDWEGMRFEFVPYKDLGVNILTEIGEIQTLLDDHALKTLAIKGSPFIGPFQTEIHEWEQNLAKMTEVMDSWVHVQASWLYLVSIFSSENIRSQMPEEGNMFQEVDQNWRSILAQSTVNPQALAVLLQENILEKLRSAEKQLNTIARRLDDYLEGKRLFFPRFFFLSNDELLDILSEILNPLQVQPHLKKCFEGIHRLTFNEEKIIIGMESVLGELVPFEQNVNPAEANGLVEIWLQKVEEAMRTALQQKMVGALKDFAGTTELESWLTAWPGQICLTVCAINWTAETVEAIRSGGSLLQNLFEKCSKMVSELFAMVNNRGQLSAPLRTTLTSLIVLAVHWRDIVEGLVKKGCSDVNDFAWLAQMQYFFMPQNCRVDVKVITTTLPYGYEYQGNAQRLVITPLTDRCHRTVMSAMKLNLGAALEGPAGTGKTETVKDLSKALAKPCIVFNCSDGVEYQVMARFFKGLARLGAWACFDDFNRINVEVLSVVAQQIQTLQRAIAERLPTIFFEGTSMDLDLTCSVFITFNPAYACRYELPDNLKVLFRTVAMVVPDKEIIAEAALFSMGFSDARRLASKIVATYRLFGEQFSEQKHYDFGLRAIISTLVSAGLYRGSETDEQVVLRSITDFNFPKLFPSDVPLFTGIISDLFPGVYSFPSVNPDLLGAVENLLPKMSLQAIPYFTDKVSELYAMTLIQHGIIVIGDPICGKTSVLKVLAAALGETPGEFPVRKRVINPKSVSVNQLYGRFDAASHEWIDGVLTKAFREQSRETTSERRWIIFDGPIDPVWAESINTVLDDNRKLCLMTGEVIQLSEKQTIIFEVRHLIHASPSTVSRCGVVYMEPTQLGYDALISSWATLQKFAPEHEKAVLMLSKWLIPACFAYARAAGHFIKCQPMHLVSSFLKLYGVLLIDVRGGNIKPEEDDANQDEGKALEDLSDQEFTRIMAEQNEKKLEAQYQGLVCQFLFSLVWSIGATLDTPSRVKFDEFFRELTEGANPSYGKPSALRMQRNFCYPKTGKIYDYYFSTKQPDPDWVPWSTLIEPVTPAALFGDNKNSKTGGGDVLVQTVETVKQTFFLDKLLSKNKPVMFAGATGTGKTAVINHYLSKLDQAKYITTSITFLAKTNVNQLQEVIMSKLKKHHDRGIYTPPHGKQMILFVNDLGMPDRDEFGDQAPLELLRQCIDHSCLYDLKDASLIQTADINVCASLIPADNEIREISPRIMRHFNVITIEAFSDEMIANIFTPVLDYHFGRGGFGFAFKPYVSMLIKATLEVYKTAVNTFLPTPQKCHYIFSLQDFARVTKGLLMAKSSIFNLEDGKPKLSRLWVHEVYRVFYDRLSEGSDRELFFNSVRDITQRLLGEKFSVIFSHLVNKQQARSFSGPSDDDLRSLMFNDAMNTGENGQEYDEIVDLEQAQEAMERSVDEYNLTSKTPMSLVMFRFAIEHISRICRVLKQQGGHCLLIGMGGSGRQSLAKLATFIAGYELFQVELTKTFSMNEWRKGLRRLLRRAGDEGKHTVFLFTDHQIREDCYLEDIGVLLNSGDIQGIFEGEEKKDIMENMQAILTEERTAALVEFSPAQLYSFFIKRVRQHLHIMLAFSPVGDSFRSRIRRFPSLVSCCTMDWFPPWPDDAFEMVANRHLEPIEMTQNVRTNMVTMCDKIHKSVAALTERYWQITRNRIYVTPTYFLELLKTFRNLVEKRQYGILTTKERYSVGLERVEASGKQIEVMRQELREIPPLLERTTRETNDLISVIESEAAQVEAKKLVVEADEAAANASAQEAQAIKEECESALADALPALNAAIGALNTLNASHITVIKTMQKPPAGVRLVMEAVCVMKGIKPAKSKDENGKVVEDYWPEAKKMLNDMKFVETLRDYNKDNVPPAVIKTIREKYVANPEFDPNVIKNISSACEGLCKWIRAMEQYDRVATSIAPRRKSLKIAEDQLAEQTTKLKAKRAEMKVLEEKLAALRASYQAKVDEKDKLESNIDQCHLKIARAEKLIAGLGGERDRWVTQIEQLTQTFENAIGDALLSVATVAYLGAFSYEFRQQTIAEWHKKCVELGIPCSPSFNFIETLGDPLSIREWRLNGLPVDIFSTQNGIIIRHASRWPLIIDPQGQANRWIKKTERANRLAVVKMSDPSYLQTLESCIQFGTPCLLENVGDEVDPVLEPLLLKAFFRQNSVDYIRLGDRIVEYSKDFRFYMTTRLRSPNYKPEIAIKVTLIDFLITPDALHHQMLGIVVALERPQLEETKNSLIVESSANKRRLKEIEDRTLEILSSSEGNILEDEEAINLMASSDELTSKISSEQEAATLTEKEIDEVRNGYSPVAARSSTIYFTVSSLAQINHMYQYRLTWFIRAFKKSIRDAPQCEGVDERIRALIDHFTYSIFVTVSTSLFEKDKLLYPFLLAVNIEWAGGNLDPAEWRFLLTGGYAIDNSIKNPAPEWISEKTWQEIIRVSSLPSFEGFYSHIRENRLIWLRYATWEDEIPSPWGLKLNNFQKLIIFRLFQPGKLLGAIRDYVTSSLGNAFLESTISDLAKHFEESTASSPMIFILSPGADPMATLYKFAAERGFSGARLNVISLGRGQGPVAERAILEGIANGNWVVLQNCHLAPSWLPELERICETILTDSTKTSADFRLWLTTFPSDDFPQSILQNGIKMIDDSPKTLRANMMKTYLANPIVSDMRIFESSKRPEVFKKLLYGLVFFHAVVQVRRKFGGLGWNNPYIFNDSDLNVSVKQLLSLVNEFPENPPIETLSYLISQCYYGGRVTDDWDRRLMENLFHKYFCKDVYSQASYQLSENGRSGRCGVPEALEYRAYIDAIDAQPHFASPDYFGMHQNANILRHKNETNQVFEDILLTLPREVASGSPGGRNQHNAAAKLTTEMLNKLPPEFRLEQVQNQYPIRYEEALNSVLLQELGRFNQLIAVIKRSVVEIQKVYQGKMAMPAELEETAEAILTGRVPLLWLKKSYPSLKPLGSYIADLTARIDFFKAWIVEGVPKVVWLSSFFSIQSFLTAVIQNHSRRYQVSISDVSFEFEILGPKSEISEKPTTGAYIDGLYLNGAAWSRDRLMITEALPNVLYDAMPVIWLKPGEAGHFETKQVFNCPVYKTSSRSSEFVFAVQLPIDCPEQHWINRGVAMICQLDN